MARGSETSERKTGVAGWNESEGRASRRSDAAAARQRKSTADKRRRVALLVLLAALCAACAWCFWPVGAQIERGLWLKGGTQVTMVASRSDGGEPGEGELRQSASTIAKRLDAVGVSESSVRPEGADHVVIDLPWNADAEAIAESVGGTGVLEFVRVDEIGDADALAKVNAGTDNVALQQGTYTAFMDGASVESTSVTEVASGVYAVTLVFNDEGSATFADVTRELAESTGSIAIVVDGRVVTAASVSEEISGGQVSISGNFTAEEANALKAVLDTGELPLALALEGSEEVGPLVGSGGLVALVAVPCAVFVAVTAFAFVRYRKLALVVGGTMVVYAFTILGLMALASRLDMFVLTIPGVVGGSLAAAATVVAAWLMVRHFHDRVASGGTVRGAALSAAREGLRPLGAPCAVAIVVACVLLLVPMMAARNFGLVLIYGVVCGVVSVFWYALTLLRLLAMGTIQSNPAAWGVASPDEATGSPAKGRAS